MLLTYKPAGEEPRSWTFRPGSLPRTVAKQLQTAYGRPWDLFVANVQQGEIDARAVALWHCLRSEHPLLRFEDLPDFAMDSVELEYEADELRDMLEQTRANLGSIPADQRELTLAVMQRQLSEAEEREQAVTGGKAPSTNSDESWTVASVYSPTTAE